MAIPKWMRFSDMTRREKLIYFSGSLGPLAGIVAYWNESIVGGCIAAALVVGVNILLLYLARRPGEGQFPPVPVGEAPAPGATGTP